jgi:hypothetical protein
MSMLGPELRPELRPEIAAVAERLESQLRAEHAKTVPLDRVGDAVGTLRIDATEIDALFNRLEKSGFSVTAAASATGVANLRAVLASARALKPTLNRPPTVDELASDAKLDVSAVRHALLLAKVMGRR